MRPQFVLSLNRPHYVNNEEFLFLSATLVLEGLRIRPEEKSPQVVPPFIALSRGPLCCAKPQSDFFACISFALGHAIGRVRPYLSDRVKKEKRARLHVPTKCLEKEKEVRSVFKGKWVRAAV